MLPAAVAFLASPRARLALLVALLGGGASAAVVWQPQDLLAGGGRPFALAGAGAVALFGLLYGVCTAAFVPRPLLNLASGALFGLQAGLLAAVAGTVIGAAIAFGLGRGLGRGALRPLVRGRWLTAADDQLSRHAFRSVLAARVFPGVPFAAVNYCAAVSRMSVLPFLLGTGLGCVPNTAAYVLAGSAAADPGSGAFYAAAALFALTAGGGAGLAWWRRRRGRAGGPVTDPVDQRAPVRA
ncbi:hypothetical protein SRB5_07050 [Streptomyces sp. RB5]|uniref:TVP38/TMEM64 family membrane protein n=1 Tax=Streptomyces smaragdinus TaxID=2585196 RepID=A0A7K0CCX0_9ACTN|nr:VTT domain-containing protein [Streptomyces smaragdinus]MQY10594.1 hypothetical protein [Streptomyces smaragdinus]